MKKSLEKIFLSSDRLDSLERYLERSQTSLKTDNEVIPEPLEEPEPILADRRKTPTTEDDVTMLLFSSVLEHVLTSWEGVPAMRPIFKPIQDPSPQEDESTLTDEIKDTVSQSIPSFHRSSRPSMDGRHRRQSKDNTSSLSVKGKQKGRKMSTEKSMVSVAETESIISKTRQLSLEIKKKRRGSREMKKKSGEVEALNSSNRELTLKSVATPELNKLGESFDQQAKSGSIISKELKASDEIQSPEIDLWRVVYPDEIVTVILANGHHYQGRVSRKLMEGAGVFTWDNGAKYTGDFVDGNILGKGLIYWPDLSWYEGDFFKGFRHGRGLFVHWNNEVAYLGDWFAGQKHGYGIVFYNIKGTDYYEGGWADNLRDGYGLRVYGNGARYLGYWKEGLQDGAGTMLFSNGDVYMGQWQKGLMNGYGDYTWEPFMNDALVCPGRNYFCGWFEKGLRHGEACYEIDGKQQICGEWQGDLKHGKAIMICRDGSAYYEEPMFVNDNPTTHMTEQVDPLPKPKIVRRSIPKKKSPSKNQLKITESWKELSLKPPQPPPEKIQLGQYFPFYAPFQNIELKYHISLYKQLKYPVESISCQTDVVTPLKLLDSSQINDSENILQSGGESPVNDMPFKLLDNEKNTQTDGDEFGSLASLLKSTSNTVEKKLIVNIKRGSSKGITTKRRPSLKPPHRTTSSRRSLTKKMKHFFQKRQLERNASKLKASYPGGLTEIEHEKKWLRLMIARHLQAIRKIYDEYAIIGYDNPPDNNVRPILMRLMLWQLYRDSGISLKISLVELDKMLGNNPYSHVASLHFPFEKIQLWQFIYSLIDVAWLLYASKDVQDTKQLCGVFGSSLNQLMINDILSRPKCHVGEFFSRHRDLLPIESVYHLYQSLGEPLSVRSFLIHTCTRTGFEPKLPPPRSVAHYPDYIMDGVNAFPMGRDLSFLPQKPPLSCVNKPTFESTHDDPCSTALMTFRALKPIGLVNIVSQVCPRIKEGGIIVNIDFEMTFLEFYEVLILCSMRCLEKEEKRLARLAAKEERRLKLEMEMKEPKSVESMMKNVPTATSNKNAKSPKLKKVGKK